MTALASSTTDIPYSAFVTASDGLRLHARCYGRASTAGIPVVCLPGLARTSADFDVLATALSRDGPHPRRVIALDYRGRGLSQYDRDPANYSLPVELADVLAVVTALEAASGHFHRHIAWRHPDDAAGGRPAVSDCRRRAQRHRSRHRAARAHAHQKLCRETSSAAKLRGRRRDSAPAISCAVSEGSDRTIGWQARAVSLRRKTVAW